MFRKKSVSRGFRRVCSAGACFALAVWLSGCFTAARLHAQTVEDVFDEIRRSVPPIQTLGGVHFWGDVYFYNEWRIQYNSMLDMYRLLDPVSCQYALGTRHLCEKRLEELKKTVPIPELKGRVLVIMHGLGANRLTMQRMAGWFRQRGNYAAVINITYTSTEFTVTQHTQRLHAIIKNLNGATEIDMIGHSLGSIIMRCYLGNPPGGEKGKLPDPRIRRFVQMCPPNGGSLYARTASGLQVSQGVAGGPVRDLGMTYPEMLKAFGVPTCEFGIISGGADNQHGYSFGLPGDDDGVITVATTRLENAADFILVRNTHAVVPNTLEAFELAERFLQHGYFRLSKEKHPVRKADIPASTPSPVE